MTMAEQIIRARKKAGLTQRELAKQLNVTNKAVSRWETGGGMPDIIQLVPLCRVLDLSLQELLDGFEEGLGKQFISSLLIQQMDENKNINTETSNDHVFIRPQIHRQMPTSTYIFGHNLEHTRACIYGGLSAQVLRNRKFAGKPSGSDGCAAGAMGTGTVAQNVSLLARSVSPVKKSESSRKELSGFFLSLLECSRVEKKNKSSRT